MWNDSAITNAGKAVLDNWTQGAVFHFDGAKAGTGTVPATALMAQTALASPKQTLALVGSQVLTGGIRIQVQIGPATTAYTCNQIGIWGSVGSGASTLIALYQDATGVSIPSAADMPDFIYTFYGTIAMSNTGTFTLTVDTSATVAQSTLSGYIASQITENAIDDADAFAFRDTSAGADRKTAWSNIKVKLMEYFDALYAKALHGHAPEDVAGLTSALSGKAAVSHAHAQADVTGLTTALAGKVDKVTGKTLSTNDLTDALKTNYDKAHTHALAAHAPADANNYVHPVYPAAAAALVKVGRDALGHMIPGAAVVKADITALGIPAQDTVYTHPASQVAPGAYRQVTVNAQGHVTAGSNPISTIAQGGTGATTADAARVNLGAAAVSHVHTQSDVTGLSTALAGKATAAQGVKADSAVQTAKIGDAVVTKSGTELQFPEYPMTLPASDVSPWAKAATKPSYTKAEVGLGSVDNTADAAKSVAQAAKLTTERTINGVIFDGSANITIADNTKIPTSQKGAPSGVAELDANGKVLSAQLPSYVDDVLEYASLAYFPATGESGKIYVATNTNLTYRWSGSTYTEISSSIALGETSSTAYRGDRGKAAYDHSQAAHQPITQNMTSETALEDADVLSGYDASAGAARKFALSAFKTFLKGYFDSLYAALIHSHAMSAITGLADALAGKAASVHSHDDLYYTETEMDTKFATKLNTVLKGTAGGLAELDSGGKVPTTQLPSLLALGETASTAYRGDRGKTAYDHAQATHAPTTQATPTAPGIMSAADKAKLDGVTAGATRNGVLDFAATIGTTWAGASAPYTQDVAVAGLLDTDAPIVDMVASAAYATAEKEIDAWAVVYRIATAAGKITVWASDKTTQAVSVRIRVVR